MATLTPVILGKLALAMKYGKPILELALEHYGIFICNVVKNKLIYDVSELENKIQTPNSSKDEYSPPAPPSSPIPIPNENAEVEYTKEDLRQKLKVAIQKKKKKRTKKSEKQRKQKEISSTLFRCNVIDALVNEQKVDINALSNDGRTYTYSEALHKILNGETAFCQSIKHIILKIHNHNVHTKNTTHKDGFVVIEPIDIFESLEHYEEEIEKNKQQGIPAKKEGVIAEQFKPSRGWCVIS